MQRAYLKIDHPKDLHDSSLFLNKKGAYRTPGIPKFTRTWILECAEDIPHRIRIRELLLMKEFGNFKYDTETYIIRLLKITFMDRQIWGSCNYFISLGLCHSRGFSFHNCPNIITNEFYVLQKSWCLT